MAHLAELGRPKPRLGRRAPRGSTLKDGILILLSKGAMATCARLVDTTVNPEKKLIPKSPGLQNSALMNSQSGSEQPRESVNEP